MMPTCAWRRCRQVADTKLGTISIPDDEIAEHHTWEQVEYVCHKHYVKILKLLGHTV